MYQPESYAIALSFMFITMLCWGSWANTMKLAPGYRFQLFYWDYVLGLFVGALLLGLTLGSNGAAGLAFLTDLSRAPSPNILYALLGGILFNIANLLLVAAIDVAGLAVAFPIGIGLALVVGAVSSYLIAPKGNPVMLFAGVALVVAAILCDAAAYRAREGAAARKASARGITLSLVAGLLMGTFYPFVSKAMTSSSADRPAPGPYAISFLFVCGVALCALPFNYLLMRRPLDGKPPVTMAGYAQASPPGTSGASSAGSSGASEPPSTSLLRAPPSSAPPSLTPSAREPPWSLPPGAFSSGANSPMPPSTPGVSSSPCLSSLFWA